MVLRASLVGGFIDQLREAAYLFAAVEKTFKHRGHRGTQGTTKPGAQVRSSFVSLLPTVTRFMGRVIVTHVPEVFSRFTVPPSISTLSLMPRKPLPSPLELPHPSS